MKDTVMENSHCASVKLQSSQSDSAICPLSRRQCDAWFRAPHCLFFACFCFVQACIADITVWFGPAYAEWTQTQPAFLCGRSDVHRPPVRPLKLSAFCLIATVWGRTFFLFQPNNALVHRASRIKTCFGVWEVVACTDPKCNAVSQVFASNINLVISQKLLLLNGHKFQDMLQNLWGQSKWLGQLHINVHCFAMGWPTS